METLTSCRRVAKIHGGKKNILVEVKLDKNYFLIRGNQRYEFINRFVLLIEYYVVATG